MEFVTKHLRPIIAGIAILVVGGIVLGIVGWHNSISNAGYTWERQIVTLERGTELEIGTCLDTGATAAQVAKQELALVKDILVNVTAARYVDDKGDPTGANAAIKGGAFVSAMHEAYPTIDVSTFKTLMSVVVGCRENVRDVQLRLQKHAEDFDVWRNTGGVFAKIVRNNYPDDRLITTDRKTGLKLQGEDALAYLTRPITVKEAQTAMKEGTMPGQDLFGNNSSATPSPAK